MTTGALFRLAWRRDTLWLVFLLVLVTVPPVLSQLERGTSLAALWSGEAPSAARLVAWLWVVLVPAAVGLTMAILRLELQHSPIAWALPGLRRRLLTDTLFVAAPVALVLALLVGRATSPGAGLAAFGIGMFCFAAGSAVVDVAFHRILRVALLLALVPGVVWPGAVAGVAERWPWYSAATALAAACALLAFTFSAGASRARPFRWSVLVPWNRDLYWRTVRDSPVRWTVSLATEGLVPWLRAALYEGAATGRSVPTVLALLAAFGALWAHLTNNPAFVLILGGIALTSGPLQLGSTLLYPLSRRRRATLASAGAALEAALLTGLMGALLVASRGAGIPPLPWFVDQQPSMGWPVVIAAAWAMAPLAQWPAVRWPPIRDSSGHQLARFGWILLYLVAGIITAYMLTGVGVTTLVTVVLALAAAAHAAFWLAVRRHFSRADLA